ADAGAQRTIIEHERRARGPVCADDALVTVDRQQHPDNAALGRRHRDDPVLTELLSKESLFYGARRPYCKGAGERMPALREFGMDGGYVQDRRQCSIDAKHRRAGAAQVSVSRSEMLTSVDSDRSLLGDAGANAVRTLYRFGPDAPEPSSPIFEAACL